MICGSVVHVVRMYSYERIYIFIYTCVFVCVLTAMS